MTNLKDQIQQKISKERERSEKPELNKRKDADKARNRLDRIRPGLDELAHTTDKYSLRVDYAKGPYSADIAVVELYDVNDIWVAAWHVAAAIGGSVSDWEVTYNPHGVETQHKWFRDSENLFKYLTASVAERVIEMEASQE